MYNRIVVGYNGTDESRDALAMAGMLARAGGGALVLACAVRRDFPISPGSDRFVAAREESARELLQEGAAAAPDGLETSVRVVKGSSPAQALHDLAEAEPADILALGSSHRGSLGRVLAGSTGERLLHGAPCAVAVAPREYAKRVAETPRVIGVGFDDLPESRRALAHAAKLAEGCGASLRLYAVQEPDLFFGYTEMPSYDDRGELLRSERERLDRALAKALEGLPAAVRAQGSVLTGSPDAVLTQEAEKGVDLLVVGSRGYGPLRRVLLGGTSARLMRSSPSPVLAIPRSAETAEEPGRETAQASSA